MASALQIRAAWLEQLLSTAPAERARAEHGVRRLYGAAGLPDPQYFVWFESPCTASRAIASLLAPHDPDWAERLERLSHADDSEQSLERARSALREGMRLTHGSEATAAMGAPLGSHLQHRGEPSRLALGFINERFDLVDDPMELFGAHDDEDELQRAESRYWGSVRGALPSVLHCSTTGSLIGSSFFEDYSFSMMADDAHRVGTRETPPMMAAAWETARAGGMWWPFEHGAILCERPAELHVNEQRLLHRGDGPAAVFRDGWRVYAWNGKAVPERWIMEPEKVPTGELREVLT